MKRIFLLLCTFMIVVLCFCGCSADQRQTYLRIHIRANSNSEQDQAVKYEVRDHLLTYLTPKLSQVSEYDRALRLIEGELSSIEECADTVLKIAGFDYASTATIKEEVFPTRRYGDLVLPAGKYCALIVELGGAVGDNWWCIAYPPLCFGGEEIKVRSYLVDFFTNLFEKK